MQAHEIYYHIICRACILPILGGYFGDLGEPTHALVPWRQGLGIQQGTSVRVGSPELYFGLSG